jgi:hypothetical protein
MGVSRVELEGSSRVLPARTTEGKATVSYGHSAYADPEIACSTTPVAYWQLQCTGISVGIMDIRAFDEARRKDSRTR